jgi:hypothetical protein
MPNNIVELLIKAKDAASAELRKVSGEMDNMSRMSGVLSGGLAAIGGALSFAAIYEGAKKCVVAFAEQEQADLRLAAAMKARGVYSEKAIAHAKDLASEMQDLTGVTEEEIESAQKQLIQFGLTGDAMDKALSAALNLAAGLDIDLGSAATLVGKAFQGQTEMLGRYGIKVDENIPKNEKFAAVMKQVEERFGDAAQAKMEGFSGVMTRIQTAVSEFMEALGGWLAGGNLAKFIEQISNALTWLTMLINNMNALPQQQKLIELGDEAARLKTWLAAVDKWNAGDHTPSWTLSFGGPEVAGNMDQRAAWARARLATIAADQKKIQDKLRADYLTPPPAPAAPAGGTGGTGSTAKPKSTAPTPEELQRQHLLNLREWRNYYNEWSAEQAKSEEEKTKKEKEESDKRIAQAKAEAEEKERLLMAEMQTRAEIAGQATELATQVYELSGKKSKEAFIAMKLAGAAEAMINAQIAATRALKEGGPYLGPILATLIYANGLARVASIRAQAYATGGPVRGYSPNDRADNIPARLTAGEYVQPVDAVRFYGSGVMEALRRRLIPRSLFSGMNLNLPIYVPPQAAFASGGSVGPSGVNIINFFDRRELDEYLASAAGRRAIFNQLRSDPAAAARAMGIK